MNATPKAWVVKKDDRDWFVGIENDNEVVMSGLPVEAMMFATEAEANECRDFMQRNLPGKWATVPRLDWGVSKSLGGV